MLHSFGASEGAAERNSLMFERDARQLFPTSASWLCVPAALQNVDAQLTLVLIRTLSSLDVEKSVNLPLNPHRWSHEMVPLEVCVLTQYSELAQAGPLRVGSREFPAGSSRYESS